jgi:hypothetical protein
MGMERNHRCRNEVFPREQQRKRLSCVGESISSRGDGIYFLYQTTVQIDTIVKAVRLDSVTCRKPFLFSLRLYEVYSAQISAKNVHVIGRYIGPVGCVLGASPFPPIVRSD